MTTAPALFCPRCRGTTFETVDGLAEHLEVIEGLDRTVARGRAQEVQAEVAALAEQSRTHPVRRGGRRPKGHTPATSSPVSPDSVRRATPLRPAGAGFPAHPHQRPPAPAPAEGNGEPRPAIDAALTELRARRLLLDDAITALERVR